MHVEYFKGVARECDVNFLTICASCVSSGQSWVNAGNILFSRKW